MIEIRQGGLDDLRVAALLDRHRARAHAETAPGHGHALDLSGLKAPGIRFWSGWLDGEPVATAALKRLGQSAGEVKSMHTVEGARGQGIGRAMLGHLLAAAEADGLDRLYLETGSWDYFAPARAFYRRHGFADCPPFGDYVPDRNSIFMTRAVR